MLNSIVYLCCMLGAYLILCSVHIKFICTINYDRECVERSNVLDWEEALSSTSETDNTNKGIKYCRLKLRPNTHFVYGGDTVDKGPGDIRLVRALVSLKKRYGDRVHLLVGNRDLNKIRLPSELSDADMNRSIDEIPPPFWDRKAPNLREYLEATLEEKEDSLITYLEDSTSATTSIEEMNTRPERLRYMLKHTLGCPDTFEFRRQEIQLLTQIYGEYPTTLLETNDYIPIGDKENDESCSIHITDDQVVDSFLYEISEKGSLYQYLKLSQIAAIIGNTIFVHGSIDELTMKYVPLDTTKFELPTSLPPEDGTDGRMIENVNEWVQALNDYLQQGLEDFDNRPHWNEHRTSRGGEAVLAIQNRPSMWGRSIVCNSYADGGIIHTPDAEKERQRALQVARDEVDPLQYEGIASNVFDTKPAHWLLEHGIQRIVVGHKPTGDCAAILSSTYNGVEIVSVDTSYSHHQDVKDGTKRFGNNRGDTIALIEITGEDGQCNWLESFGTIKCGTEYSNRLPTLGKSIGKECQDDGDLYLGRRLSDGWWVKASIPPNYYLCRGSGRTVEYQTRPKEEIISELD